MASDLLTVLLVSQAAVEAADVDEQTLGMVEEMLAEFDISSAADLRLAFGTDLSFETLVTELNARSLEVALPVLRWTLSELRKRPLSEHTRESMGLVKPVVTKVVKHKCLNGH